jgi:mannose-6-phosphate isomerase-like protein (cupin superfamily)
MSKINLCEIASKLPSAWKSSLVGRATSVNIKVLRMDESEYEEEVHDYAEALLVLDGCMNLAIAGKVEHVQASEIYIVPPGVPHGVAPGSRGTLVIIDQ